MRIYFHCVRLGFLTILFGASGLAAIALVGPYLGLGENENFILYRTFGLSRTYTLWIGIVLFSVAAVVGICWWRMRLVVGICTRFLDTWRQRAAAFLAVTELSQAQSITYAKRDQLVILCLAAAGQALIFFIIPLAFECDAAAYFAFSKELLGLAGGHYTYYRAPLFAAFVALTGQPIAETFYVTLAVHFAIGIVLPVLLYRIVVPFGRWLALLASVVYMLSTAPFYAAKIMMPEQIYGLLLLSALYCLSRYYYSMKVRFLYLTAAFGTLTLFTRWESSTLIVALLLILLILALQRNRHSRHLGVAVMAIAICVSGFSLVRSYAWMGNASLFGTVNNFGGRHAFWMTYWGHMPYHKAWDVALGWRDIGGNSPIVWRDLFYLSPNYIEKENGPANREIWQHMFEVARDTPEKLWAMKPLLEHIEHVDKGADLYEEYFGRLEGRPEAFADNVFRHPNGVYTDFVSERIIERIGILKAEDLYKRAVLETLVHTRQFWLLLFAGFDNILSLLGIDLPTVAVAVTGSDAVPRSDVKNVQAAHLIGTQYVVPPFLEVAPLSRGSGHIDLPRAFGAVASFWDINGHSNVPYNIGNCAKSSLPTSMQEEIKIDHELTRPFHQKYFTVVNFIRNMVRNVLGPLILLSVFFVPFAKEWRFGLCISFIGLAYLVMSGMAGNISAYTRYEVIVQPLLVMVAAVGVAGLRDLTSAVRQRL